MHDLAESAAHAAHALDDWRLVRPHQAADVEDFLQKISPLASNSDQSNTALILVIFRGYEGWNGEKLRTVPELREKVRTIIDRLASAIAQHSTTEPAELATLRDFCLEVSRQARVSQ